MSDGVTVGRRIDRNTPPPPGEVKAFRFPHYVRHRLTNGLTVLAARSERGPLAQLALVFPAGAEHDPAGGSGTATLVGALLDEGTEGRSAPEIAVAVESLGGHLTTGADWDSGYLDMQVLSRHSGEALRLLAELATGATLPPEELERQQRRRLADLLRKGSDPSYLAGRRFAEVLYDGTPYGHTLVGDETSVEALERDDLLRFYRRHYALGNAFLLAAGDLDTDALVAEAETVLGSLASGAAPPPPDIRPPQFEGLLVDVVDRPGAAQTELRVGHAGVSRSHPDFVPLQVMNGILGGKFTSRINLNLRERHGYTYGASSGFSGRRGPGPFRVRTAVATEVAGAAVREIVAEMERIRAEPVEREELEDARTYMVGTFPYTLQTVSGLLDRLENLAVYELPEDYYDTLPERIQAVTREDVLRVAREHLRPADLAVVAVGPESELSGQFS